MKDRRTAHASAGDRPLTVALAAFAVGFGAVLLLRFGRGFFWPHAVISGLAVAALVYSAWRTVRTMRERRSR